MYYWCTKCGARPADEDGPEVICRCSQEATNSTPEEWVREQLGMKDRPLDWDAVMRLQSSSVTLAISLRTQLEQARNLASERFEEIQRAQRIIDDMKVNRESQIANIPHDVWEESSGTIHVAIKILRDRLEQAKKENERLKKELGAKLEHERVSFVRRDDKENT